MQQNKIKKITKIISKDIRQAKKGVAENIKALGPGLITGAADDDPSGVVTYTTIGAQFGYQLSWLALFSLPLMIAIQEMCARIGAVTGQGLAGVLKNYYSRWILYFSVLMLLIANGINIGANLGALAAVAQLVLGGRSFAVYTLVFVIITLLLEIFISYKVYVHYLKWLTLSLLAYAITAVIVHHEGRELLRFTFLPTLDWGRLVILGLIAFLGTTISPYLFFWQASSEVEEEIKERKISGFGEKRPRVGKRFLRLIQKDVILGMFFSNLVAYFIMITAAATLFRAGISDINSAADAARALEPLGGKLASFLFALGIIGTGLLGIPVLAGSAAYAVAEVFGWKEGLYQKLDEAKGFYGIIILSTLVGLFINFVGISPMKALYFAAVVNGIIASPLILIILLVANNKKIMGKHNNKFWSNLLGILTFILMTLAIVLLLLL